MDEEMRPLDEQPDEENGAEDPFDALFSEADEGGEPEAEAEEDPLAKLFEDTEDLFVDFDEDDEDEEAISVTPDEDETGELIPPVHSIEATDEEAELIEAVEEPPVAATDAETLFEDFDDVPLDQQAEQEAAFDELFGDLDEEAIESAPVSAAPDVEPEAVEQPADEQADLPKWLQEPAVPDEDDTAAHAPLPPEPTEEPAVADMAALFDGSVEGLEEDLLPVEAEEADAPHGLLAGFEADEWDEEADQAPLASPEPSTAYSDASLDPSDARDMFADFDDASSLPETSAAEEDLFAMLDTAEGLDPFRELEAVAPPTSDRAVPELAAEPAPRKREPLPEPTSDETPEWLRELGIGEGEDLSEYDDRPQQLARPRRRARSAPAPATNIAFGMTPSQRLVLAVFLFVDVAVIGLLALYALGAVDFAF
jgi:hypothetical protein